MERGKRRSMLATLGALALAAACGGGGGAGPATTAQAEPSSDWMDGARVVVAKAAGAGRETVTLLDEASGTSAQMDDEALDEGAVEIDDAQ